MDYLKTRAPFWKKETRADGTERWVDARASDDERGRAVGCPGKVGGLGDRLLVIQNTAHGWPRCWHRLPAFNGTANLLDYNSRCRVA